MVEAARPRLATLAASRLLSGGARTGEEQSLMTRQGNRLFRRHRPPCGAGLIECVISECSLHMGGVPIANPPDRWRQGAADAVQQAVRGTPQLCRRFRVPARGQESGEHVETPRNPTCVLEFVASRQRFGSLTMGAIEIASYDAEASG